MNKLLLSTITTTVLTISSFCFADGLFNQEMQLVDEYTLKGNVNLISEIEAVDESGNINAVIEIPKGKAGKWEINSDDPTPLIWEFKKGVPRTVDYKGGYPANYASIPQTSLTSDFGGDGEPLDLIIISDPIPRGTLVKVKILGIFNMQEGDEYDGKLVGVLVGSNEAEASSLEELNSSIAGSVDTVKEWFANYKGEGEIILTEGGLEEALEILIAAATAYSER